jgi:hypothetical protein
VSKIIGMRQYVQGVGGDERERERERVRDEEL